jgi:vitamin B12 transporter
MTTLCCRVARSRRLAWIWIGRCAVAVSAQPGSSPGGASTISPTRHRSLGGYGTLDLRAGFQIDRSWLLQLQLSNLLNKNYETAQYYNRPGRSVFVTLRYRPAKY